MGRLSLSQQYSNKGYSPVDEDEVDGQMEMFTIVPKKHPTTYAEFLEAWADEAERKRKADRVARGIDPPQKDSRTRYLRDWDKYTFDLINRDKKLVDQPEQKLGVTRLNHYFTGLNGWAQPGGDPQRNGRHIFFGILAREGFREVDFDWKKFRSDYFAMYPGQRAKYNESRKAYRKMKRAKKRANPH